MATTAAARASASDASAALPIRASPFDSLLRAIDRFPLGPWAFYPALAVAVLLLFHVEVWTTGAVAVGVFDPTQIVHGFYVVYPLALLDYLHRAARRSWRDFRPAIDVADDEAARLGAELVHVPSRALYVAAATATAIVLASSGDSSSGLPGLSGLGLVLGVVSVWAAVGIVLLLIYDIARMLLFVRRILDRVVRVNLFRPQPLYAFSRLTLRAGVGVAGIATFQLLTYPAELNLKAPTVAWLVMLFVAATAAFVLPLRGIHDMIVLEKRSLEGAAGDRLEATIARLHAAVDGNETGVDDSLNKRLASLVQERELLARLPTWPWQVGTARTFASAILLPIVIWLLTRFLGRVV